MKMRQAIIPTSFLFLAPLLTFACSQILSAQTAEHPSHHAQNQAQNQASPQDQSLPATGKMPPGMNMPGMDPGMPGMNTGDTDKSSDNHAESGAMRSMQPGHHMDGAHMRMTPMRPATPDDLARADQIATALRQSIEPYRDYRVALAEGYKIFMPNLPQAVYHFTNYWNGFLEGFTFDPARPTSLLYKKTKDGYELVGAMYTAPRSATLEQLDERVPLGIASWHVHTNLCVPRQGQSAHADWTKFGLTGSISTPEACSEAGGKFYPQIFGWMVHVYPFETSRAKVWGQ
jgi:hypothetical protein